MKNFVFKNKILRLIVLSLMLFAPVSVCYALPSTKDIVDLTLGSLSQSIVAALGWLLQKAISMLIGFANYSDFVNNTQVVEAWLIVRDLCNMFFILILLFIAFAVILRLESYNIKKSLPKLLLMAVLINFSRTICGIMIDFSQIIMLTFVSAFSDATGNFHSALQVDQFLTAVRSQGNTTVTASDAATYYIVAILFMIVSLVVILAILMAFLMRIVMFWIYIVLSPLAFLLSSFSAGQKYASQYWGEFTKYLINGPVLAFFVWMSLAILNSLDTSNIGTAFEDAPVGILVGENLASFIMAIGMLVGGLMISSQIGGVGASWGSNTVSSLKNRGISLAKRGVAAPARLAAGGAKSMGAWGVDKASQKLGVDLNVARGYKRMQAKRAEGRVAREQAVEESVISSAQKGGRAAMLSHGALAWENLATWKGTGRRRLRRGAKGVEADRESLDKAGKERDSLMTSSEANEKKTKLNALQDRLKQNRIDTKEAGKEVAAAQTGEEKEAAKAKYDELLSERKNIKENMEPMKSDLSEKTVSDSRVKELDSQMSELRENINLKGGATAAAQSRAEMEGTQSKKISHIENSDELGTILAEAIEEGNQGLISAVTKKMTRGGDYNEMLKKFGYGTGTKGMQDFAKEQLQDRAKMSDQASLGLVAELGNLAKNIHQYGAFGAATLENGQWRKSTNDEAQMAQLAEMLKVQPQEFARKTNRLGLGEYTTGDHSTEGWKLSDAATAYIKMNHNSLEKQYGDTGQQNAIEHLALATEKLRNNKVNEGVIKIIEGRATQGGTDVERVIKSTKQ